MEHSEKLGIEWLQSLLTLQGLAATVEAELVEDEFGASCWLTIQSEGLSAPQVEALIGEQGQALDAMQYLANTTLNLGRSPEEQQPYTIELAGHRAKRKAELITLATAAAATVQQTGEEFEMVALSSAERRQVHHFLSTYEGLETFSRGREPERHLVVRPASASES